MIHVVVVEPEIPPNTGNMIRMCANSGAHLHLVEPLGFTMTDARLRRAGLDYQELTNVRVHPGWDELRRDLGEVPMWAFATSATRSFSEVDYEPTCALVFGKESSGLDHWLLDEFPVARRVRIPMVPGNRSLNLSNAAAVGVYEVWRRHGFAGAR